MMNDHGPETKNGSKFSLFDIVIIVLSIYVLLALMTDTFFVLPPETDRLLDMIDNIICIFFLADFGIRFYRAEKKLEFMKWGWIDLVSSIPNFDFMRVGRLMRIFRLLRVLRAFRSTRMLAKYMFKRKSRGAFTTAAIIGMLMWIFSSIAILNFETDPDSNIKSAEDALWWSFVTLTTTGYGDRYPITTEGRIVAGFLMITGVGLFGTFTGYIASWFVEEANIKNNEQ